MNKRDSLIALCALGLASAVPRALAQPAKPGRPRTIGALTLGSEPKIPVPQRLPSIAFRKLGWIEGENFLIERRWADLKAERLAPFAEELVRKRVEVIWAYGPDATLAAARATQSIPIVFTNVPYPIEQGLIDSFARPGRNATGTSFFTDIGVAQKLFEFLRAIAPAAKRLSVLTQPDAVETVAGDRVVLPGVVRGAAAERMGFEPRYHEIRKLEDIDAAFQEIIAWRADAIAAGGGEHLFAARQRIAEFALRHRLPVVSSYFATVEAGGLLSYGVAGSEAQAMVIRCVEYVDRILRGARPGELPVERPSRYELVINAKTAQALGLKIPPVLRALAARVIE
jgi:putative ABC transport system substrate-binding protein